MQKQCGLQRLSQDPAPVDGPVKSIEFGGVVERIKDKRGQAKDVKMRRPGSRPAPEEDVETDGKVNQRNEPQALVLTAVGGLEQNGCVDGNARTEETVVDVPPGPYGKPLMGQERYPRRVPTLLAETSRSPALIPARSPGPSFSTCWALRPPGALPRKPGR